MGESFCIARLAAFPPFSAEDWARCQRSPHTPFSPEVENARRMVLNDWVKPLSKGERSLDKLTKAEQGMLLEVLPRLVELDRANALWHMQIVRGKAPHGFAWCSTKAEAQRLRWRDPDTKEWHAQKDYSITSHYVPCAKLLGASDEWVRDHLAGLMQTQFPEWAVGELAPLPAVE